VGRTLLIKTNIKKYKGYYILQVIQDLNNESFNKKRPIELMTISKHDGNQLYKIADYRYTDEHSTLTPYLDDMCGNNHRMQYSIYEKNKEKFTFPFKEFVNSSNGIKLISWNDLNGIIIDNADNPHLEQKCFKSETHIWSYKAAMQKLNEAKLFWESFDGDNLEDAKIKNLNIRPTREDFW
jgi:hypothetical protein